MKTAVTVTATTAAMVLLVGGALAFMAPGHGPGMRHGMMMQMGSHMMTQGAGSMGSGTHGGAMNATQVTEDQAKAIAQKYVDEQLKGFTIEKVVPSTGMPRTMYTVELKGPKGETKTLHVSPSGHVMPFAMPQRQG
jgi:membrane-bound ClpP family serine protease